MIDGAGRDRIADTLLRAYDAARVIPQISGETATFDLDDAFAVADRLRALRLARGERQLGYKIGFTNRGIWARYGVHAPIWGPVWDTTTAILPGREVEVSLAGLSQPRLEPEVVFGLACPPEPGMDEGALAGCVAWVAHGFEIVHTHFDAWRFTAADCQADFALHGRLYIGPRVPIGRFDPPGAELAALRVTLHEARLGAVETGTADIVLDGPLNALRLWVDAMAAQRPRWPIRAGDIVTTGTITDAWPMQPGQCWHTELSDARLSGLTLRTTS